MSRVGAYRIKQTAISRAERQRQACRVACRVVCGGKQKESSIDAWDESLYHGSGSGLLIDSYGGRQFNNIQYHALHNLGGRGHLCSTARGPNKALYLVGSWSALLSPNNLRRVLCRDTTHLYSNILL
jgi:hypothetical protein